MNLNLNLQRIKAPELETEAWFNSSWNLSLGEFLGKPVVLHAFQMLCPGCILHGLPQTQRLFDYFDPKEVQILGLHTVFEHHSAMQKNSLEAFVHEFRYKFPIGIDRVNPSGSQIPVTMERYDLKGTPSLVLIDKQGLIAKHYFGSISDLELGSEITKLIKQDV